MPIESYKKRLKDLVSPSRFEHVCRVADMSKELAGCHGVDSDKAFLAGLLHDSAKQQNPDSMKAMGFHEEDLNRELYLAFPKVWHAFVAPQFCETLFDVSDRDIQKAMACHTTGAPQMTPLEQIVFLADYVEVGRPYKNCSYIRDLAFSHLDDACFALSSSILCSLVSRSLVIHPKSIACYNYYASICSVPRVKEIVAELNNLSE
jgi:predicted HD superfamily hydrolase involved in NAD metabolism